MTISLTNSLGGKKEEFKPITEGTVGMYHCGPTVYDYIHIGNLRAFVTADLIRRVFEFNNYTVTQVMNITDVGIGGDNDEGEDKIIRGLKREGKPITLEAMKELTEFYTEAFKKSLAALNIKMPHHLPLASAHIAEDIALVQALYDKGFAYTISDGVYFDTSKDPSYGKLGGISKDDSELQARISQKSEKKSPRDFALWKFNSSIGYESPWGQGFPGWHIECSAMSKKYLGDHFDIHTGGVDLIPIHHNNEIAQSENACGCEFVHYWLHNAHVQVATGKMAKSEGTGITLQKLTETIPPLAYRYWLLGAHYRTPMMFSTEAMDGAKNSYEKLKTHVLALGEEAGTPNESYLQRFTDYVNDDIDTAKALALLWDLLKDTELSLADKKATALAFDTVLGLGLADIQAEILEISAEVQEMISKREEARKNRDWAEADKLRALIEVAGFDIKDSENGPVLTRKNPA